MNSNKFLRKSIILIVMLLLCNALAAQDRITFTWEKCYYGKLTIRATDSEQFTIDWGDDTPIETKIGLGNTDIHLFHEYEYGTGGEKFTVNIAASNDDCKFIRFNCCPYEHDGLNFQISSLTLEGCSDLMSINCLYNRIPLSNLYSVQSILNKQCDIFFGSQFVEKILSGGMTLDFSSERIIGGVETVFEICKYTKEAVIDVDYSIVNGIITFIKNGYYEVWLKNDVIPSASFYVGMPIPNNIPETSLSNFKIYPNPTNDVVYIETENETTPEVKLYSIVGKLLQQTRNTKIDLSGYAAGLYLLSIDGQTVKIVKR